jgi:hypothetical protein
MRNHVTISARFASRADYLANTPESVKFFYAETGKVLSPTHAKKIERITAYQLAHDLYPVFVTEETVSDDSSGFEAEAWIDLNVWSNKGIPRFKIRDITTGKPFNTPCCNTGVRPSK